MCSKLISVTVHFLWHYFHFDFVIKIKYKPTFLPNHAVLFQKNKIACEAPRKICAVYEKAELKNQGNFSRRNNAISGFTFFIFTSNPRARRDVKYSKKHCK